MEGAKEDADRKGARLLQLDRATLPKDLLPCVHEQVPEVHAMFMAVRSAMQHGADVLPVWPCTEPDETQGKWLWCSKTDCQWAGIRCTPYIAGEDANMHAAYSLIRVSVTWSAGLPPPSVCCLNRVSVDVDGCTVYHTSGEQLQQLQLLTVGADLSNPSVHQDDRGRCIASFILPFALPGSQVFDKLLLDPYQQINITVRTDEDTRLHKAEVFRYKEQPGLPKQPEADQLMFHPQDCTTLTSFGWLAFYDKQATFRRVEVRLRSKLDSSVLYECTPEQNKKMQLALSGSYTPWLVPLPLFLCNDVGCVCCLGSLLKVSIDDDDHVARCGEVKWLAMNVWRTRGLLASRFALL